MASIAFTETLTSGNMFIGRASIGLVPYGSTPPVDLGGLDSDAEVKITLTGEILKEEVHRQQGAIALYLVDGGVEVEALLRERTPNTIVKLFGKGDSDITDNSTNTPKDKTVAFGQIANTDLNYWLCQLQIAQTRGSAPLYDFFKILKCVVDPTSFELAFGRKTKQSLPIKLLSVADPTDSTYPGAHAVYQSEYV